MRKFFCINIDLLEITYQYNELVAEELMVLNVGEFKTINNLLIQRKESFNYHYEYVLFCKDLDHNQTIINKKIGYLNFGSTNPNRSNIYVLYCNRALYDDFLLSSRFGIEEALSLEFLNISKLDIAIDFNYNIQRHIVKAYKNDDYELIINGKNVLDESEVDNVSTVANKNPRKKLFQKYEFVISNANKDMTMKVYDKKKEIIDNNKQYIIDKSRDTSTLYRLEISCKSHKMISKTINSLKMNNEELYSSLQCKHILFDFFNSVLNRLIRLRKGRKTFSILDIALSNTDICYLS